jgi:UDP-N-acetylglucosamine 4,6-dehydratase/5-epimerase
MKYTVSGEGLKESNTYVITGGTGSFGKALTGFLLPKATTYTVRVFSRDELKQHEMAKTHVSPKIRYFIGDVRDEDRLNSALSGADVVIHAAAMKQVGACEYNPYEAVKTNIIGTANVISACIKQGVEKAIFISSDKAVDPVNLYGATKLVGEKIWLNSNNKSKTLFSVTRWGNVMGSRGSVIPLFEAQKTFGRVTITDKLMTRFWITLPQACQFLWDKLQLMKGGETFVPDLPSARMIDLAKVIAPRAKIEYIGIQQGEKIHETLGKDYYSNDPKRLLSRKDLKKLYESISGS